jgi:hypothetical protein
VSHATIRDEIARQISAGDYPAGALLPSIHLIMRDWKVSTTNTRRVLDELAATEYARKEGTRGHISTGGPASASQVGTFGRSCARTNAQVPQLESCGCYQAESILKPVIDVMNVCFAQFLKVLPFTSMSELRYVQAETQMSNSVGNVISIRFLRRHRHHASPLFRMK